MKHTTFYFRLLVLLIATSVSFQAYCPKRKIAFSEIPGLTKIEDPNLRSPIYISGHINFPHENGKSVLMAAVDDHKIVECLLKHGADENQMDDEGRTPLYYALIHDNKNSMRILLAHKANPHIKKPGKKSVYEQSETIRELHKELFETPIKTLAAAWRNKHPLVGQLPAELVDLIGEYATAAGSYNPSLDISKFSQWKKAARKKAK